MEGRKRERGEEKGGAGRKDFFFFFCKKWWGASRDLIYLSPTLDPEMLKIISLARKKKKRNPVTFPQLFNAVGSHKPSMIHLASLCSKLLWNWVLHKCSAKLRDLVCPPSLEILPQVHFPFAQEKKKRELMHYYFH